MALHLANPAVAAQGFTTAVGSPSNGRRSLEPVFTVRLSHSVAITTASFRASSNTRAFIVIGSADPSHDLPICTVLNPTTATLPGLGGRSGSSDGKPSRPSVVTSAAASSASYVTQLGGGGGDGAGGSSGGGGSGGGGGGGGDGVGGEGNAGDAESDYGPILGWPKAEEVLSKAGVTLPEDMLAHVKEHGIAELLLQRYIDLQVGGGILAAATRSYAALRDRLLADPSFLFKVLTEVVIDSGCATFAEVQKRGEDFWKEIDLYTSDILVGIAVDSALVSMLAPMARFGSSAAASAARGRRGLVPPGLAAALEALPSSMFEAALPGRRYSVVQRGATWLVKGAQYAVVGFSCGLVGQAISTAIVTVKRNLRKPGEEEEEVKIPGLLPTACLWGGFMAVSSNTRYQIINGLERVVESSAFARSTPLGARIFTVLIRFSNNIFGSSQFVEVARWSGVQ
ncbi:hypothetical protein CLOM_g3582 [Closterium sp. NIES-68]|nr:hypothetical protein CLOM_g3582 [Closterium sp. NIES-68]GJP63727.1 hypothetical protein CLOP_g20779 [Closterium sp. NIES-67]